MLLIAADEAGYGPKLGPLVIVGTAWDVPDAEDETSLEAAFGPLRDRQPCGPIRVAVDDSKSVYAAGKGLAGLHAMVSASHHWCGHDERDLAGLLKRIAADDWPTVQAAEWLCAWVGQPLLAATETRILRDTWSRRDVRLSDVQARVVTAAELNRACRTGNKADLLSESTIGLCGKLAGMDRVTGTRATIFCDRHGGRRYYAGVLQHIFSDAVISVLGETNVRSSYQLTFQPGSFPNEIREIIIHFTVKGDAFTPVALSSIHAKYLRERLMESFNHYFSERYQGETPFKPTAGYPVDADRFLRQVEAILISESIATEQLVRSR